jgi:DNA helicase-2/ATP-dependent DNA helicase PcrA
MPNVRLHRPAILHGVLKTLREASSGTIPLTDIARRVQEENRGVKPRVLVAKPI